MNNTKYIIISLAILLSGSQSQATIYAATKLTKGGQTVYLLSDVDGESADSLIQKHIILDKVRESNTSLIARDPRDIRRIADSLPKETHALLQEKQAESERVAGDLKALRQGLITLAYARKASVVNLNYESVVFMQGIPLAAVKSMLNEVINVLRDQLPSMTPAEQKNFWQHVIAMNKLSGECIPLDRMKSLAFLVARLEQLIALKGVKLADSEHVIVCSIPEDIECLAAYLSKDGWEGDVSGVMNFSESWGEKIDLEVEQRAERDQRYAREMNQLDAKLSTLKKPVQQRLINAFNKKWANVSVADPVKRQHEIALKCSRGPVNLKKFFAGDVLEVVSSSAASSSDVVVESIEIAPESNPIVSGEHDAYARMNRAIELQHISDMHALSQPEKSKLAAQVYQDLMPILKVGPSSTDIPSESVYMQIHAAELTAYFYWHAQEYDRACRYLCNALGIAHNNKLYVEGADLIPYHTPNTVMSLAYLIKTPAHKNWVLDWMASSGHDEQEQTAFIAELEQLACHYSSVNSGQVSL